MSPPRVLIVDDEESVRGFVAEALKMDDLEVESAQDGLDAMRRLEAQWYDLVVSDLRMPRRSEERRVGKECRSGWCEYSVKRRKAIGMIVKRPIRCNTGRGYVRVRSTSTRQ